MEYNYIPMGFDCSPAAALKCIGIRKMSLPFDWVQSTPELIIACIKDNFKQFHQNIRLKNGGTRVVDTYGFQYPHDYPTNGGENDGSEKELVDNYGEYTESVLAKYARRIERLRGLLTDNKPIIILMRSFAIARRTNDPFGRLVTTGVIAWYAFQLFENIGMTLGLMPMTGVPLPFVSYGGSSMFATLIGFGLLQNVHARSRG